MTPEQRDLLILRYLDGTASAAEVAKLEEQLWSDEEARLLVRDLAEQAVGMADFARERMIQPSQQGQNNPQSLPQRRLRKWWLPAACIALVVGGIAFWVASTDRVAVTIAHVSGAVSFTPKDGQARFGLEGGERVPLGTFRLEGATSTVQLSFDDGNSVILTGDAELVVVSAGKEKLLTLYEGLLTGDVRPQEPGRPMVIRTPIADAEVIGARFMLAAGKNRTDLLVESGSVKLRYDGSTIEVPEGQEAVAELGAGLKTRGSQPQVPDTYRRTFEKEPPSTESWRGTWFGPDATTPGRLRCVTDLSYRRADGTPVVQYTVNVSSGRANLVTVTSESVLHLRFRMSERGRVLALIGLRYPEGEWLGNFMTMIQPSDGAKDEGGWRTVHIPLASMKGTRPSFPPGSSRVFFIHTAAYSPKANLEVAEVSITPADSAKTTTP